MFVKGYEKGLDVRDHHKSPKGPANKVFIDIDKLNFLKY